MSVPKISIEKGYEKLKKMDKEKIREILEKKSRECYYCGIPEDDFIKVWGIFYKTRGSRLEIERKDNNKGYSIENCVLACAICNNAKSNKFTEEDFKEIGKVIKRIWKSKIN